MDFNFLLACFWMFFDYFLMILISLNSYMGFRNHVFRGHDTFIDIISYFLPISRHCCLCVRVVWELRDKKMCVFFIKLVTVHRKFVSPRSISMSSTRQTHFWCPFMSETSLLNDFLTILKNVCFNMFVCFFVIFQKIFKNL